MLGKGAKTIQWRKNGPFNRWCWASWMSTCKRMKLDPYLTPYKKLTQNGPRIKTIKFLEENTGVNLHDLLSGNRFRCNTKGMSNKRKNDKLNFIEIKNFLYQRTLSRSYQGFPGGTVVKNLPANAGDTGSSPDLGRSHMLRSN